MKRCHTIIDDLLGQMGVCAILQMGYYRPHGIGAGLQFAREGRIVTVRFEFNMRCRLADIHVHPLEHLKKLKPHIDEIIIAQKDQGDRLVRQHIIKVRNEGPVAMILHHLPRTIDDKVIILDGICEGEEKDLETDR